MLSGAVITAIFSLFGLAAAPADLGTAAQPVAPVVENIYYAQIDGMT